MKTTLQSLVVLSLITTTLTGCSSKSNQNESPAVAVESQLECAPDNIQIKNVCVVPDQVEGDYRHFPKFGQSADYWFHVPTKQIFVIPQPNAKKLFSEAQADCLAANQRFTVDLPVQFQLPSESDFFKFVTSEALMRVLPSSGDFWTSTKDNEGWVLLLELPSGSRGGAGNPAGARAQTLCVAQVE